MCRRGSARASCASRRGRSWRPRMPDPADPRDAASAIRSTFSGDASDLPETIATYLRLRGLEPSARSFRKKRRRADDDENAPFTAGRDPRGLGDVIAALTRDSGWNAQLAREDVVRTWNEVAGADTAGTRVRSRLRTEHSPFKPTRRPGRSSSSSCVRTSSRRSSAGSRMPGSRASVSSGRTSPRGNGVPEPFQGAVRAIPTADRGPGLACGISSRHRAAEAPWQGRFLVEWNRSPTTDLERSRAYDVCESRKRCRGTRDHSA